MNTPTSAEVLADPSVRDWLKDALRIALDKDPVDALADAELLARVLRERAALQREIDRDYYEPVPRRRSIFTDDGGAIGSPRP